MSSVIKGLLYAWQKNRDYGQSLVADLSEEQMTLQPAPAESAPSNHPAWVFSHLNVYLPVIVSVIEGKPFEDPKSHPFGMLSKPELDSSIYAPKEELLNAFVTGHDQVTELLGSCNDGVFEQAVQLPRWEKVLPVAAMALPYLMLNHENGHLGQISAWRRIQGMPSV